MTGRRSYSLLNIILIFQIFISPDGIWSIKKKEMYMDPGEKYGEMTALAGGVFQMGIDDHEGRNGEAPSYKSAVKAFYIDLHPVTNYQYKNFLADKKRFVTDAEARGFSMVFVGHLKPEQIEKYKHGDVDPKYPHMIPITGAKWDRPFGFGSDLEGKWDHPVVHVSKQDANSYCYMAGKRLPSEFEWEFAARGGLPGLEYPWGDDYEMHRTNLWQGDFPHNDSGRDGFAGTSPVENFKPQNSYGLYDMVGNVWEWTKTEYHYMHQIQGHNLYTLKGGSYLDSRRGHVNLRARVSVRDGRVVHYSASNIGFRCARELVDIVPRKKHDFSITRMNIHAEL